MFGFLKNKNKIDTIDFKFLRSIVSILPPKYKYLYNQISEDFMIGKEVNKSSGKGAFSIILNAKLEKRYSNKSLPQFFIVKGIKIWNIEKKAFIDVELDIVEGMLAGFICEDKYQDLDLDRIDISNVYEKKFNNKDKEEVDLIMGKMPTEVSILLNLESSFKINISQGEFYTIKDFEDGNYLSVDKRGAIYAMIHDPYEIEKLFDNKEVFYAAITSGEFSVYEYYDRKMS